MCSSQIVVNTPGSYYRRRWVHFAFWVDANSSLGGGKVGANLTIGYALEHPLFHHTLSSEKLQFSFLTHQLYKLEFGVVFNPSSALLQSMRNSLLSKVVVSILL